MCYHFCFYSVIIGFNPAFLCQVRAAVLNSSPRAPPLRISYVTLIASDVCSIRTQVPCEVDITEYSAMIPVRSERIYSIQSALKCARHELKLYIFTEVYDVTLARE